jgi:uncharacterized NAD-dependent epimerase/dehydratase family protein
VNLIIGKYYSNGKYACAASAFGPRIRHWTKIEMIRQPYLLFLGDVEDRSFAKTAFGLRDWCPEAVVGQCRLVGCSIDLGLAEMRPAEAVGAGAGSLLIGVASAGGQIPPNWIPSLVEALEAGLDIVSGMHTRLRDLPEVRAAADRMGRRLHDVRHADRAFPIATGRKRSGLRVLTVGTDCALGKKYTSLAVARGLSERGLSADFRATGQTGVMIAGDGLAIDAVVSDFLAGAVETLSPAAAPDHWDVIEGQGSLFHPSYAAVTVGLIHGSQPDALILCHDPCRTHIAMHSDYAIPPLTDAIAQYLMIARLTNPMAKFVGVSLNTSELSSEAALEAIATTREMTGLGSTDPIRFGVAPLVDSLIALTPKFEAAE